VLITLAPCASRAAGSSPRAERSELKQCKRCCRGQERQQQPGAGLSGLAMRAAPRCVGGHICCCARWLLRRRHVSLLMHCVKCARTRARESVLCACTRARECASVLRLLASAAIFCSKVRDCVRASSLTDCRNHQPSPLLFYASHSASHMTR
jgi:hypothetical protein